MNNKNKMLYWNGSENYLNSDEKEIKYGYIFKWIIKYTLIQQGQTVKLTSKSTDYGCKTYQNLTQPEDFTSSSHLSLIN